MNRRDAAFSLNGCGGRPADQVRGCKAASRGAALWPLSRWKDRLRHMMHSHG